MVIVLSGPGGVGKGTVVERLIAEDPGLWLSRSWTTRSRRPSEPEDAYVFVDRGTFERKVAEGGFLEHAEFLGNLYGTPVPDPEGDRDVVLEIDVQGAAQVRSRDRAAMLIFLDAPSPEVQRQRLLGRGDDPGMVEQRLDVARSEAERAEKLGAIIVINDDLDTTVAEIHRLIRAGRST